MGRLLEVNGKESIGKSMEARKQSKKEHGI
jgi:hypothetical protein